MYECLAEGGITRIMACLRTPRGLRKSAASAAPGPIMSVSRKAWTRFTSIPAAEEAYDLLSSRGDRRVRPGHGYDVAG